MSTKTEKDTKAKKEMTPNRVVCCVLGCGSERADRILKKIGAGASELVVAYENGTARGVLQRLREKADEAPPAKTGKQSGKDEKVNEGGEGAGKTDGK